MSSSSQSLSTISPGLRDQTSAAIDLSPADDIFFHGQLLPLQLLSYSPRPSVDTIDLPLHHTIISNIRNNSNANVSYNDHHKRNPTTFSAIDVKSSNKFKPLSSFLSLIARGKRVTKLNSVVGDKDREDDKINKKHPKSIKMSYFDNIALMLKKNVSMISSSKGDHKEKQNRDVRRRLYSFSGTSNVVRDHRGDRRTGDQLFSPPVSMRTSPANSGVLVAGNGSAATTSSNESAMEELQNAIQVAIAHCKRSVAIKEDKLRCSTTN